MIRMFKFRPWSLRHFFPCQLCSKTQTSATAVNFRRSAGTASPAPSEPGTVNTFRNRRSGLVQRGPSLQDFIAASARPDPALDGHELSKDAGESVPYLQKCDISGSKQKVFFDVYGCQMNVNDTEIVWGILKEHGFQKTTDITESDVILLMTCSIREHAEDKVWNRLQYYKHIKRRRKPAIRGSASPVKIGILGCMAERLKEKILEREKLVDLVCGPDSYRDLPRMVTATGSGQTAVNVLLSLDETYADVVPVRLNENAPSAFVSIMRGCDNMCTYCIVPFTRGRERSRPIPSILDEISTLSDQGVKEVTLLGQNVNSYQDKSGDVGLSHTHTSRGFSTVYKPKAGGRRFADLLDKVSLVDPEMRVRFTSPHPKDFPDEVLTLIKERANICSLIHLPAQSGSSSVLTAMRRGYSREAYVDLVHHIKSTIPDVSLTSDFISGFCGETEEDHQQSLNLIRDTKYCFAYCFPYSMRQKTAAHHRLKDDVPQETKDRRHMELVEAFRAEAWKLNTAQIGQTQLVLTEGLSKRSSSHFAARNDSNIKVIIADESIPELRDSDILRPIQIGDYVAVKITSASSQTLIGRALHHSTLQAHQPQQAHS